MCVFLHARACYALSGSVGLAQLLSSNLFDFAHVTFAYRRFVYVRVSALLA